MATMRRRRVRCMAKAIESPPKWQGGRYTATMVKENNQWHIRSLSLVELLDGDEGDAQP